MNNIFLFYGSFKSFKNFLKNNEDTLRHLSCNEKNIFYFYCITSKVSELFLNTFIEKKDLKIKVKTSKDFNILKLVKFKRSIPISKRDIIFLIPTNYVIKNLLTICDFIRNLRGFNSYWIEKKDMLLISTSLSFDVFFNYYIYDRTHTIEEYMRFKNLVKLVGYDITETFYKYEDSNFS